MIAVHLLAALPLAYALISAAEWYVHRYHMHRRGYINAVVDLERDHRRIHHPAYRRCFTVPDHPEDADTGVASGVGATLLLAGPASLALALVLPIEAAVLLVLSVAHAVVWTAFHREMHQPRGRWICRNGWYRLCRARHVEHHRNPSRNFAGLCPGADFLMGTAA